jgi:predicted transposase YdaD
LKNLNRLDRIPDRLREKIFERLFEVAEVAKFSREELLSYEDSLKYYRDLKNSLDTAFEEGKMEGFEEGKMEGFEEGKLTGLRAVVIKGKQSGMDIPTLSLLTGLTEGEISQILSVD